MGLEGLSICPLCRAQPSYLVGSEVALLIDVTTNSLLSLWLPLFPQFRKQYLLCGEDLLWLFSYSSHILVPPLSLSVWNAQLKHLTPVTCGTPPSVVRLRVAQGLREILGIKPHLVSWNMIPWQWHNLSVHLCWEGDLYLDLFEHEVLAFSFLLVAFLGRALPWTNSWGLGLWHWMILQLTEARKCYISHLLCLPATLSGILVWGKGKNIRPR